MTTAELLKRIGAALYLKAYKQCYDTGIYTLHVMSSAGALWSGLGRGARKRQSSFMSSFSSWLKKLLRGIWGAWRREQIRFERTLTAFTASFSELRQGSVIGFLRLQAEAVGCFFSFLMPLIVTVINYALPLLALVALLKVVDITSNINYGLSLTLAGKEVGVIESEAVFDSATARVMERMEGVEFKPTETLAAQFKLVQAPTRTAMLDEYELSDIMISSLGSDLKSAYGLYVGGSFEGATSDRDELLSLLAEMQDRYLTGAENETASFVRPITVREGLYPVQNIMDIGALGESIDRQTSGDFYYEVVSGDMPTTIANRFDMSLQELEEKNPGVLTSLPIGAKLVIAQAQPYMSIQVQRIEEYEEEIKFKTEKIQDNTIFKGEEKVETAGRNGVISVRAKVSYLDSEESGREVLSKKVVSEAVNERIRVGTKAKPVPTPRPAAAGSAGSSGGYSSSQRLQNSTGSGTISGGYIRPVASGYTISNYFYGNNYSRYNHGALDFAAPYGTPIRAAASGTVTYSAYTVSGYGRHIKIDHGNGVQTLYAHNSQNIVSVGQRVSQGQIIGYVGSTGNSTGNHCHFEILINGGKVDPSRFVAY